MPACRVVIATNFPEGNWQSRRDGLELAQEIGNSLGLRKEFQGNTDLSICVQDHFRALLNDLTVSCDEDYFLFLTVHHLVDPATIGKAVRKISDSRQMVMLFPSRMVDCSAYTEAVADLLYMGTPPLVAAKLPPTSPLRLPGLMIHRESLSDFMAYLQDAGQRGRLADLYLSSDGIATALRSFLAKRGVDVHLADAPLFQMHSRYADKLALSTEHRRLLLTAIHKRLAGDLLGCKKAFKAPHPPLRKRMDRDSIKRAASKWLGASAASPFEDIERVSLRRYAAWRLLRKANKLVSTRLGVVSWRLSA